MSQLDLTHLDSILAREHRQRWWLTAFVALLVVCVAIMATSIA